jgi:hypothetical protein
MLIGCLISFLTRIHLWLYYDILSPWLEKSPQLQVSRCGMRMNPTSSISLFSRVTSQSSHRQAFGCTIFYVVAWPTPLLEQTLHLKLNLTFLHSFYQWMLKTMERKSPCLCSWLNFGLAACNARYLATSYYWLCLTMLIASTELGTCCM